MQVAYSWLVSGTAICKNSYLVVPLTLNLESNITGKILKEKYMKKATSWKSLKH